MSLRKIGPTISWAKKPRTIYSLDDVNVWTLSANHFEELKDFRQRTAEMDHKPIFLSLSLSPRDCGLYNFYMETVAHVFEQSCTFKILQSHVVVKDISCSNIMYHC